MSLPASNDLQATWAFIEPGLDCILGTYEEQGVSPKMYMNCYTAVFNFCIKKSRRAPLQGPTSDLNRDPTNTYSLAGAEVYAKLDLYLSQHIANLHQDPTENFLHFYARKWIRFTVGAGYLNNVFDYMNRYWVLKERLDGRRDVYDVNTLALLKWKDEMFFPNSNILIGQVLDLIEAQRNNEIVDSSLISTVLKSLAVMGIDAQDLKRTNLQVYINHFEGKYIDATSQYYKRESDRYLAENSVVDYMVKCESRISEEIARANNYLEENTKKKLREVLHDTLIKAHSQEMYANFLTLLEQQETEHMRRMYHLLSRVPTLVAPLADSLCEYIKDQAAKAFDVLKEGAAANAAAAVATPQPLLADGAAEKSNKRSAANAVDPKVYVNTIIDVHAKYNSVVVEAFRNDTSFIRALDNACRYFVNNNVIATPTAKLNSRTPDILAKYADSFLKATAKDQDVIDLSPEKMITVFKYITDKDPFEEYYRRMLAKRLINSNCKSEELEESIIQLLQEENSIEYTSKMTKMFSDMRASEDLRVAVKDRVKDLAVREFHPLVLAHSMWPFVPSTDYNLKVAPELEKPFSEAAAAYASKHLCRQLQWLWNHGRAEIKANLLRRNKAPFLFTVSNVQLMIILAFNHRNLYTVGELYEKVGTSKHIFDAHLLPLTRFKLLEQSPPGAEHAGLANTLLTMVDEYKLRKLKVSFVAPIKTTELRLEEDDANREIDETRRNYLLACIVRIMKLRKVVTHNDLVNEVMLQTAARFQPKILVIKRVIDQLIEKQYIERRDNNSYEYLS